MNCCNKDFKFDQKNNTTEIKLSAHELIVDTEGLEKVYYEQVAVNGTMIYRRRDSVYSSANITEFEVGKGCNHTQEIRPNSSTNWTMKHKSGQSSNSRSS